MTEDMFVFGHNMTEDMFVFGHIMTEDYGDGDGDGDGNGDGLIRVKTKKSYLVPRFICNLLFSCWDYPCNTRQKKKKDLVAGIV